VERAESYCCAFHITAALRVGPQAAELDGLPLALTFIGGSTFVIFQSESRPGILTAP